MTATIAIDSAGRLVLPVSVRRRLGIEGGSRLRLAVVADRIELTPEAEPALELVKSPTGRRVLKPTGVPLDAAAAVRAERDGLALPRRRR